jgi:hypothetical protein
MVENGPFTCPLLVNAKLIYPARCPFTNDELGKSIALKTAFAVLEDMHYAYEYIKT